VAQIEDAGRRASAIVRRILSFGRQSPLNPEPIRLRPVIEEALELVRPMFAKGVAVSLQVDGEPPWVGVDANQVHQVMVNLLTNAAHALGERGGQIAVRLRAEGANGTGAAVLEVEDDGCGMDETVQKRMFEPFYTTKAERGTGLGLAVVRSVVASCRGSIAVRSAPGAGTRFTLRFPAVPAPSGDAPGVSVLPARDARVLYVDDDADLVFLVTGLLRSRGYRPTGCSSAEEALQRFRADPQSYDAVISDMSMPRMSGLDLAREVLGLRPDLPFVITTGYVRDSDAALARQLGVRAVLVKPDTMDALAAALEREFHSGSAFEPKR
jgi:CheY-like chemotaxis protein/anti-sigma regulatory factor (Ser/Thr protein kinase)